MSNLPVLPGVPVGVEIPGLEDFDQSDMTMPVLVIDHKAAVFQDKSSGVEYPKLENAIILGLIKQRVLWPAVMGDKDKPLCRSYDGLTGNTAEGFPWDKAGFTSDQVTAAADGDPTHFEAPCKGCKLADWDSHPSRETPWCSLQHTFAILVNSDGAFFPSLLTIQRAGLKASNSYLTGFQRSKQPLFSMYTTIELEARSRGGNDYAVPKFLRAGATPEAEWPYYSETFYGIRGYVQTPRGFDENADATTTTPVGPPAAAPAPSSPPASVPAPAAAAPVTEMPAAAPAAATPAPAASDDLPF